MRKVQTPPESKQEPAVGDERSGGDRREPQRSEAPTAAAPPDPEVSADRPKRRTFRAEYKKRILDEADACSEPGEIGELLRREGLYSSHLTEWRRLRDAGSLAGLAAKKRGRKAKVVDALAARVAELERDKRRLEERLRKAELIIDVQKKVAALLGVPLADPEKEGSDS
jgi:transposase